MSLTSVTSDSSCLNRLLKQPPTPCFTDNSAADSLARWHPLDWRCPARSRKVVMSSTNSAFSAKEHSLNPSTMQFFHNGDNQSIRHIGYLTRGTHWWEQMQSGFFCRSHQLGEDTAAGLQHGKVLQRRGSQRMIPAPTAAPGRTAW